MRIKELFEAQDEIRQAELKETALNEYVTSRTYYVVTVDGKYEDGPFKTQMEAKTYAKRIAIKPEYRDKRIRVEPRSASFEDTELEEYAVLGHKPTRNPKYLGPTEKVNPIKVLDAPYGSAKQKTLGNKFFGSS